MVCHGIPGDKPLKDGDTLNIDVTVIKDGYHGDTSSMFHVGNVPVLALTLVQEALTWLHRLRLSRTHPPTPRSLSIATAMALSGSAAIEAMGAVCRAEYFHVSAFMTDYHVEALDKTRGRYAKSIIERQEAERISRTQHAALMNKERHKKDREAKEKAIALWERNPSRWPSVPKAAIDIVDILEAQGYKYELSTVQGWLYAYGKQTSIKLR